MVLRRDKEPNMKNSHFQSVLSFLFLSFFLRRGATPINAWGTIPYARDRAKVGPIEASYPQPSLFSYFLTTVIRALVFLVYGFHLWFDGLIRWFPGLILGSVLRVTPEGVQRTHRVLGIEQCKASALEGSAWNRVLCLRPCFLHLS